MSSIEYMWCLQCHSFKSVGNNDKQHEGHSLVTLGNDQSETIFALDDVIQYGQDSIAEMNSDIENARRVEQEIKTMREKFKATLYERIERIVRDLREALDEQSMALLGDVDKKVTEMENNAKTVIQRTAVKLDTANSFLKKAAVALPDDNGQFSQKQLTDVYVHYNTLNNVKTQTTPKVESVSVKIKFPNTMKVKTECRELSKSIIGEIENTKRPSLLDAQRASIDVTHINDFNKQ